MSRLSDDLPNLGVLLNQQAAREARIGSLPVVRVAVDDGIVNALIDATAVLDGDSRIELEALLVQMRIARRAVRISRESTCPDCDGKSGTAPNGVKYCRCPDVPVELGGHGVRA